MSSLMKYLSGLAMLFCEADAMSRTRFFTVLGLKSSNTLQIKTTITEHYSLFIVMRVARWMAAISVHYLHVSNSDLKFSYWEGVIFFSSNWPRCSAEVPNTESFLWESRIPSIVLSSLKNIKFCSLEDIREIWFWIK